MSATPAQITMKTYQCLVEARAVQRRMECRSIDQTADVVRRALIAQLGLRRFLGLRMNSHTNAPAAGWVVEFDYGRQKVYLDQTGLTLVEAVEQVLQSQACRAQDMWPTGVRRGELYIEL